GSGVTQRKLLAGNNGGTAGPSVCAAFPDGCGIASVSGSNVSHLPVSDATFRRLPRRKGFKVMSDRTTSAMSSPLDIARLVYADVTTPQTFGGLERAESRSPRLV